TGFFFGDFASGFRRNESRSGPRRKEKGPRVEGRGSRGVTVSRVECRVFRNRAFARHSTLDTRHSVVPLRTQLAHAVFANDVWQRDAKALFDQRMKFALGQLA